MSPLPDSVKALARGRAFLGNQQPSVWPLRDSQGRTWAERKAMNPTVTASRTRAEVRSNG